MLVVLFGMAQAAEKWADMPEALWEDDYGFPASVAASVYSGFPDGYFRPYEVESREQFIVRAERALATDLEGSPAPEAVGHSSPKGISRKDAAVLLAGYLAKNEYGGGSAGLGAAASQEPPTLPAEWSQPSAQAVLDAFVDSAAVAPEARAALAYLVSRGVFRGDRESRIQSGSPLLRAQAVAVVFRTLAAADRVRMGDVQGEMYVGLERRTFLLHIPEGYETMAAGGGSVPLVLAFHGVLESGAQMAELTGFSTLAEEQGFVVVYPDGLGRRWNAGFFRPDSPLDKVAVDDVVFVDALIARLSATLLIDPDRVYAVGFSNGGMFSYRLADELSGRLAAVASVSGTLPEPLAGELDPSRGVSVLAIHGTADPVVPFAGGMVSFMNLELLAAQDTAERWADVLGLPVSRDALTLSDVDPGDGTRVTKTVWSEGRDGAVMELYVIEGGGHTWPGGPTGGGSPAGKGSPLLGPTSRDIDATRVIWRFFEEHPVSGG